MTKTEHDESNIEEILIRTADLTVLTMHHDLTMTSPSGQRMNPQSRHPTPDVTSTASITWYCLRYDCPVITSLWRQGRAAGRQTGVSVLTAGVYAVQI